MYVNHNTDKHNKVLNKINSNYKLIRILERSFIRFRKRFGRKFISRRYPKVI